MNASKPTTTLMIAIILAMGGIGAAYAGNPMPTSHERASNAVEFNRMDTNHDGRISLAEATSHGMLAKAFKEADDNHSGYLSRDEFIKAQAVDGRLKIARYLDDSVITAKVKAELIRDSVFKGLSVDVQTSHGTVELSGFVKSRKQADKAARIAAGVAGVKRVVNGLIVES